MMTKFMRLFLVVAGFVVLCESSVIFKNLKKCDLEDMECQKNVMFATLDEIFMNNGSAELGIPNLNPYEFKNVTIKLISMLDVLVEDGTVENLASCIIDKYKIDFAKGLAYVDLLCDKMTINAHYIVMPSLLLNQLMGNALRGKGYGGVDMGKARMSSVVAFNAEKRDDGEIYLVPDIEKTTYKFTAESAVFNSNSLELDDQEISPVTIQFLNQNWKFIFRTFGKHVSDVFAKMFFINVKKFFDVVPSSEYLNGDLSVYLKS